MLLSPFQLLHSFFTSVQNVYDTASISMKKPRNATLKGLRLPHHSFPLWREVLSLSLICFYSTCVFCHQGKTSIAHYSSNPVAHPNCLFHCFYLETSFFLFQIPLFFFKRLENHIIIFKLFQQILVPSLEINHNMKRASCLMHCIFFNYICIKK